MRLFPLCLCVLCFLGCEGKSTHSAASTEPDTTRAWYSAWISKDNGEQFYSELTLAPGEVGRVSIPSETPIVVGFIVEKGYEVSKDSGTIYMGTEETPHMVGGAPGTWKEFEAPNGLVAIRLENTSTVATRIAIYTKPKE